ncbi:MAG: hypothetical protein QG596_1352, partial [Actinomycetota bacterium]|nr:hypothetical protein [Actinomycetota bacterium]
MDFSGRMHLRGRSLVTVALIGAMVLGLALVGSMANAPEAGA